MPSTRQILLELDRRKNQKINPCDSCDGKGTSDGIVCAHCLGQGVLLTTEEYETILIVSGWQGEGMMDDYILEKADFEYD